PNTLPPGPVFKLANRTSVPEPEPMSRTVTPGRITSAANGYPTPANDSTAVGGSLAISSAGYPTNATARPPRGKWYSLSGRVATSVYRFLTAFVTIGVR